MEDLNLLQAEAAAADREIADSNAALLAANDPDCGQQAPVIDEAAELQGIIELAAGLLAPVLPKTAATTKAQAAMIAASGAEVMKLHGFTMGGFFLKFGPYIGLGMSVLPVVVVARGEIAAQNAAAQKQAANDGEYQQPKSAS